MAVAWEGSGKWASKLIADGFIPLHEQAGNLQHHIVGVVRHDAVQVRSRPHVVVLIDERFDLNNSPECSRSRHGCLLRSLYFRRGTMSARQQGTVRLGLNDLIGSSLRELTMRG